MLSGGGGAGQRGARLFIDELALCELARKRPICGWGLDAFVTEPLPADANVRELPDAFLTPHRVRESREADAALPLPPRSKMCGGS